MGQLNKITITLAFLTVSSLCQARLIQIIHTNDLHSYFEGYQNGTGSYARLMTKIKELRADAASRGVEVLQLDGGDWGEGTSYFIARSGVDTVKALEMLGTDVATIGNHDHQLGGKSLGRQLRAANSKTKFSVANLVSTPDMELGSTIVPFVDVDRGDISIRVIGLTTPDLNFQYSISPGKILSPNPVAEAEGGRAKLQGRELVIALTHLGLSTDESLAKNTSSIDVIVGGHSHTKLSRVRYVINKQGKSVPIVQAWAHGLAVGSLLLDVKEKGGGVEVVDYDLHKIDESVKRDPEMANFVQEATERRNQNFDLDWNEVLGETKTPMTGYLAGHPVKKSSCWGYHMATAARKAVGAPVGIHISNFEGVYKAPGPVTFANIADNFPHLRKFGDQGWEIATIYLAGWKLRPLMYYVSRKGYGVTFSGLGYKNLISEIKDKATYRIAFPAEVALAIQTSMPQYERYLSGLRYTGQYYWPVMAQYVRENSPISCR